MYQDCNSCSVKTSLKRMEGKAACWENVFANHIVNKGFVPGVYKASTVKNPPNNPIRKRAKVTNRHITKESTHDK